MHRSTLTPRDAFLIGREDAHGQAALVRTGEVTAAELIEAAIIRIERLDPMLNAVTHRAYEEARGRARSAGESPLAGVPYLLKDSLEYPGMPSYAGSRSRDETRSTDAHPYIRRFDEQGLIPLGMTSMPEFGLLPSTEPLRHGPTHNPWSLGTSAGGSSGGAAAAVAAGMVPLAHASDAAGSIRIPAACCGLVGLKASRGANVRARGHNMIDDLLCSDVLLARSVRDVAWAFNVGRAGAAVAAPAVAGERRLRIAVDLTRLEGALPEPEVASVIEKTAALCTRLGHRVENARLTMDGSALFAGFHVLWGYLGIETVEHFRAHWPHRDPAQFLEPWAVGLAELGRRFGPLELERAFQSMMGAARALAEFFRDFDVVLSPVVSERAPPHGRLAPTRPFAELSPAAMNYMGYTHLQNMAGTPAIALPLFTTADGMPVGSMFAAARGGDDLLLSLAFELERAQPWCERWPACFLEQERASACVASS